MATSRKKQIPPAEAPPAVDPVPPSETDPPETLPPVEEIPGAAATDTPPIEEAAPAKRGRGRPPGSGKTTAEKSPGKKTRDVADFARQIQGLHRVAAMATGLPVLEIADHEAAMLASGITAVADEYGLALSGKTGAALQLFAAMGFVYGPRVLMVKRMRDEAQRAAKAEADAAPGVDTSAMVLAAGSADGTASAPGN